MQNFNSNQRGIGRILFPLLLSALLLSVDSQAAGFAITENGAKELGIAFGGGGAIAEDGSTVWFNPAGMTRVGKTLQISANYVDPSFDFVDNGSAQLTAAGDQPLLPGASGSGSGGKSALVPNIYYVRPLSERLYFGLGLNAPFGLATEYEPGWIGRYQAVKSEITTFNLNPALAFRLSDQISIGAGININYIEAELTNAIDFAAICAAAAGAICPNNSVPGQGQFDGFVRNKADDTSIGTNIGVLWSPSEATRISIAYRSQINHSLTGAVDFSEPSTLGGFEALGPLGSALGATFADGRISSSVSLPDTAAVSIFHQLSDKVAVMGDITWTDWADIPELRISFDNPLTPAAAEALNWKDAWRFSTGVVVDLNDRWTLRSGYAYDESPVPNAASRTSRLPDNDRQWFSFGVSHRVSKELSIDAGYAHLFIDDTAIARLGSTANVLSGKFNSDANILSLQLNYALN